MNEQLVQIYEPRIDRLR